MKASTWDQEFAFVAHVRRVLGHAELGALDDGGGVWLERAFKVKIPRGKIVEEARGDLSGAEFDQGGVVSPAGFERLKSFLNGVPAERFKSPLKVADIYRRLTA